MKLVEKLGIAPKAYHYEQSINSLGETVIILDYIDGTSLDNMEIGHDTIVLLAKTVAQLHSTPTTNFTRQMLKKKGFKEILQETKAYIDELAKNNNNNSASLEITSKLNSTYQEIVKNATSFPSPVQLVLGHGDIDPSNVILQEEILKFIDWESLSLIDPALEIAGIFDSFDLSTEHQEIFFQEYLKIRNNSSLRNRTKLIWPVQLFKTFCWAINHVLEIKTGKMHEFFIKEQNLEEHVNYAKKMFYKCKKARIIDENVQWDGDELFSLG
ncbi:MAG: phosphotransferase [Candidatus Hodarchaeales archaeon]